ncbi:MAG: hypothetical protein QXK98_05245 [Candidatus Bathyarchaeia archaeon]
MNKEQLRKKIIDLFQKKGKIEEEIQKLQNQLVQQLCPKEKQECEPAYCTFRITDTCPFLKEWSKILEEGHVQKDTKYDDFIDFIEKFSANKGISPKN